MAGFNGVGAAGSGLCKMVASFKFGTMLKGLGEAESVVTVVASPVLVQRNSLQHPAKKTLNYSFRSFYNIAIC